MPGSPPPGRHLIERPRLTERLDAVPPRSVTVLHGPAGHGRRTLLAQWMTSLAEGGSAWLAPGDRDARPVWTVDGLRDALAGATGAPVVVEDLDPLTSPGAVRWVREQIESDALPSGLVVVSDTRWPAGHRGRTDLVQLGRPELAFSVAETTDLLRRVELPTPRARQLTDRCMGWPAAVHAAVVAAAGADDVDRRLAGVGSDDPYIVALVQQELLAHTSERVRRFLVRSSVLPELEPTAAATVLDEPAARAIMRLLERRQLFLHPVGDPPQGGTAVALEPLLREVLRRELRRGAFGVEDDLIARAFRWYREHGEPALAAQVAIEAERWEELLQVVDEHGPRYFERGEASQLLAWLDTIAYGPGHPGLDHVRLRRAYVLTMLGRSRRAAIVLSQLDPEAMTPATRVVADALRTTWGYWHEPPSSVVRVADATLRQLDGLPPDGYPNLCGLTSATSLRMMAAGQRARALWYDGDAAASRAAFAELVTTEDGYAPWRVHICGAAALVAAHDGRLGAAELLGGQALALARSRGLLQHPATIDARLAVVTAARERDHLEDATRALRGVTGIAARTYPVTTLLVGLETALLWGARGRPERGLAALESTRRSFALPVPRGINARLVEGEVTLHLAAHDETRGRWVLARHAETASLDAPQVQLAALGGDTDAMRAQLATWQPDAQDRRGRVQHGLWTAVLEVATGARRRGLRLAAVALADAEDEALLRTVLDAGAPVHRLLRSLDASSPTPFVRQLLDRSSEGRSPTFGLSDRELEVLRRLPGVASNQEIAGQLHISNNTLKTHLRGIYRKLGVRGRREAVLRAADLGLV